MAVWAESAFEMFQRRSAGKEVAKVSLDSGLDSPIDWAIANAANRGDAPGHPEQLFRSMFSSDSSTGRALRSIVVKSVKKWAKPELATSKGRALRFRCSVLCTRGLNDG